jgi:hypothetical protein
VEAAALSPLAAWESFYVIVGSSAGALTGLQFVVITLGAEARAVTASDLRAFVSPTIVHFCGALLVSAILSAPWPALGEAGWCLAACGVAGLAYSARVLLHARRQTNYAPDLGDWLWFGIFPLLAYGALLVGAILLSRHPVQALFLIGATVVFLLFIGIHNAWDGVTYIAVERMPKGDKPASGRKR